MTALRRARRVGAATRVLPTYARADVTIVRGEGCRVWDDAGREYLDFVAGIAVVGLGHCAPAPLAAAHEQLDRLWHASNLYWTEPMLRLAALLAERFRRRPRLLLQLRRRGQRGGAQDRAQGDRAARGSWRSRAASTAARSARSRPPASRRSGRASARSSPGVSFARPNDVESLEAALAPAGDTALLLLEPVLGEGGVIPLEPEFAQAAAELALEVGALLCVDEVQAGHGPHGDVLRPRAARDPARPRSRSRKGLAKWAAHWRAARRRAGGARVRPGRPRLDVRRQPRRRGGRRRRRRGDRRRPARRTCASAAPSSRPASRRCPAVRAVRGRGLLIGASSTGPSARSSMPAASRVSSCSRPARTCCG